MPYSLLPHLEDPHGPEIPQPGGWKKEDRAVLWDIARGLSSDVPDNERTVSSIPNMWARPLLVDNVLWDKQHPLHGAIKEQWRGMLSAIALAGAKGFSLSVQLVDLSDDQADAFLTSLRDLIPEGEETFYTLRNGQNPWERIYVFVWGNNAVGMTSPTSLICPSEDDCRISAKWQGCPWYQDGGLQSPLSSDDYLNDDDKIQLYLWLDELLHQLRGEMVGKTGQIIELVRDFQEDIRQSIETVAWNHENLRCEEENFFGDRIDLGRVTILNRPIGKIPGNAESSSFRLTNQVIFLPNFEELPDGSCRFRELERQWHDKRPINIRVYDTSLLDFRKRRFLSQCEDSEFELLKEEELFLPDLFYFKSSESEQLFTSGVFMPQGSTRISFRENKLTPLLPISARLLVHFSPEELNRMITLEQRDQEIHINIKLRLKDGEYNAFKRYTIREDKDVLYYSDSDQVPILEIFPNFRAEGWREYYVYYYDESGTLQMNFSNSQEIQPADPERRNLNSQIIRLNQFPSFIDCRSNYSDQGIGLILLKNPREVGNRNPDATWTVGVDFGTSFTNVFYKQANQGTRRLTLSDLSLQVIRSGTEQRSFMLGEYFMPKYRLPLSTILTTRGAEQTERAIFDGRIYDPPATDFNPHLVHIKTGLKWRMRDGLADNKLFLRHLGLLVSAQAASESIREIEWNFSYPSSFSDRDKNGYGANWQGIIEDLRQKTGMLHRPRPLCTEALAMARYLDAEEQECLQYTTCIDMGGGTSDIVIWENNQAIHQCSVQLAGHLLFSQFLRRHPNPKDLGRLFSDLFDLRTPLSDDDLRHRSPDFYAKIDAILASDPTAPERRLGSDFVGSLDNVIALSTLGTAGLYYYVGIILRGLHSDNLYGQQRNTPVFVGGNGCRIFHWLSDERRFNPNCKAGRLFSRMLSRGSGFDDREKQTFLSDRPKDEVAWGLVLDTQLRVLDENDSSLFSGEEYHINEQLLPEMSRIILEGKIGSFGFKVGEFSNLRKFFEAYHNALRDLRIEYLKYLYIPGNGELLRVPITDITGPPSSEFWDEVQRRVDNYCTANIIGKDADDIRLEAPFIIGLKTVLEVLHLEVTKRQDNE